MQVETLTPEDAALLKEIELVKAKLLKNQLNKFERRDLQDFYGKQGSTPKKGCKRKREEENTQKKNEETNTDFPMKVPSKKKKYKKPIWDEEFQTKKGVSDLEELAKIPISEFTWCLEVCKGYPYFTRKAMNMESEKSKKLIKMFKKAQAHWECTKCGNHTLELAKTSFIYCDSCDDIFHGACVDKNLQDEAVRSAPFECEVCST